MTTPERREKDTARRLATHGRGLSGEGRALLALMLKGYWPLARRYGAAGGEIDLVMRRGRTIAFIEVKARATLETALAAIDGRKRARFSRAVRAWVAAHPECIGLTLRADAVLVAPRRWPTHLADAFPLEER